VGQPLTPGMVMPPVVEATPDPTDPAPDTTI